MVDADGASPRSRSIRFAADTAVIPARKRASGDADGRSGEESDGVTAVADAGKRSGEEGAPVQAEELRDGGDKLCAAVDGSPLEPANAPLELSHMALDGAAPVAKIVTQRKRREANVAKTGVDPSDEVHPLLITPGTVFMDVMSDALERYAVERVSRRQTLENVTVYASCVRHAGEGELKLVRWLRSSACDGGTAAVVSGDATARFAPPPAPRVAAPPCARRVAAASGCQPPSSRSGQMRAFSDCTVQV